MNSDGIAHPLDALQIALASNDMRIIETTLLSLDTNEMEALRVRLGEQEIERLFRSVRSKRRAGPMGRVVVIHGIMGGQLDSVKGGDADRVWLNYARLFEGRIANFRLKPDGSGADPKYTIKVKGMFPEYLPLLTELGEQWNVLPFAFDWRLNIDDSVKQLAKQLTDWAKGEPVHIVAHSMGGLVARRFIQLFPQLWNSMQDPTNQGRGGRLIMMGTPNKGSFAIPLILSGKEKTVKKLELLDVQHNMSELLEIINTFPGSYQMLPSPDVNAGDDHTKLYDIATWAGLPVVEQHLKTGRAFQQALTTVTDPERLVYVAGYDQETPCRIKVESAGNFTYQTTLDGDGRVPHLFGLLDDVRTFYVREVHGDLVRNESVLAAIHELLVDGITGALEAQMPATRSAKRATSEWKRPDQVETPLQEQWSILKQPFARGTTGKLKTRGQTASAATVEQQALIETTLLSAYIGSPRGTARGTAVAGVPPTQNSAVTAPQRVRPSLSIQVVWGDITKVDADIYVTGHYERVAPQGAALALDHIVSNIDSDNPKGDNREPLLTALTRRGILSGQLGHVQFFPWANNPRRSVAVAGMGYPGSFGRSELRHLTRSLTYAVGALPNAERVCTVLIGSGAGNELNTATATSGLIFGMLEAIASMPLTSHVSQLCIVERDYGKANEILRALEDLKVPNALKGDDATASDPAVHMKIVRKLIHGDGGVFDTPQCLSLALQSTIDAARDVATPQQRNALKVLLDMIPEEKLGLRKKTAEELGRSATEKDTADFFARAVNRNLRIGQDDTSSANPPSTRISFVNDGSAVLVAAITNTAVVPQRQLAFDLTLLDETIERMTDPYASDVAELSRLLAGLVVPREFRDLLARDKPIVFEVDRSMARVHWEMLSSDISEEAEGKPIALSRQMSRQLRTQFSPPPAGDYRTAGVLRALVVGDPGDPGEGNNLPGAQDEAFAVAKILQQKGVQVKLMVGAPGDTRTGRLKNVTAASRLDVLKELMKGGYDLLHYAGHGDFDPKRPDAAGWVFKGGLITSRELEQMDAAPRLVVANACLSALTSSRDSGSRSAEVLPSLADEFFKRGVRNYIGTAWEVNDFGAVEFAQALYDLIIPNVTTNARGSDFGTALLHARSVLYAHSTKYDALWAAYQHYGDPAATLNDSQSVEDSAATGGKVTRKRSPTGTGKRSSHDTGKRSSPAAPKPSAKSPAKKTRSASAAKKQRRTNAPGSLAKRKQQITPR